MATGHVKPSPENKSAIGVVQQFETSYFLHNYSEASRLIDEHVLELWFHINPNRFGQMLARIHAHHPRPGSVAGIVYSLLFSSDSWNLGKPGPDPQIAVGMKAVAARTRVPLETLILTGNSLKLRLQGEHFAAYESLRTSAVQTATLWPLFDKDLGWGLFSVVQHGVTAMLAGEFEVALVKFAQARLHDVSPALAFLHRDAYLKAALIEALYGDETEAIKLLSAADAVPRTTSWVEDELDVSAQLVMALVGGDGLAARLQQVESIPLRAFGEMLPFAIAVTHRLLMLSGNLAEAGSRLRVFEGIPFPGRSGSGYAGSVIVLARAEHAVAAGDLALARTQLQGAQSSLIVTQVLATLLEFVSGRVREAFDEAMRLRRVARPLRQLDIALLAVIAEGHLRFGEHDDCRAVLAHMLEQRESLTSTELRHFSMRVRTFAAEHVSTWAASVPVAQVGQGLLSFIDDSFEALTEREVETLKLLARGYSREQIASAQFLSVNTVKGYAQSLYRKLGVKSRTQAVIEGERRGLL